MAVLFLRNRIALNGGVFSLWIGQLAISASKAIVFDENVK